MNGMKSFEDLNFLKVKGVNQMAKEIAETHDLDKKVIDRAALHRNEQSNEYEGMVQTMANNLFINLSQKINKVHHDVKERNCELQQNIQKKEKKVVQEINSELNQLNLKDKTNLFEHTTGTTNNYSPARRLDNPSMMKKELAMRRKN